MSKKIGPKSQFKEVAVSKGYRVQNPSFSQRKNNIDVILEGQLKGKSTSVTVDIKKQNGKKNTQWVYVEYDNSKGGKGWIYGGAEFIVFETKNEFTFVSRKKLLDYLSKSELIRWDLPYVDKAWNSKYRLFRRSGTLETITQVKLSDVLCVSGVQTWQKL